jgi:hypothetical protein
MFAFSAPFVAIFGGLGGSVEDDGPSIWPEILRTAILLALLITTLSTVLRRRRASRPN